MARPCYELDTVVLVYVWNDILQVISERGRQPAAEASKTAADATRRSVFPKPRKRGAWRYLVRHSYAINTYVHRRRRLAAARRVGPIAYPERIRQAYAGDLWTVQRQLLEMFNGTAERGGARLAVIIFPWLRNLDTGDYVLGVMHQRVAELFRSLNVPHLDLLDVMSRNAASHPLVINDLDSHPSAIAHRLAAEEIIPFLEGVVGHSP